MPPSLQQPFQQNLHQPKSELLNCQLNHLFTSFLLSLSPINTLLVHHLRMILIPLYIVHLSFNNSFVQQPIANDIHTQFRLDCRYILQVAPQGTRLIIFLGTTIIMWYQRGTRYLTIPPFIAVSSSHEYLIAAEENVHRRAWRKERKGKPPPLSSPYPPSC